MTQPGILPEGGDRGQCPVLEGSLKFQDSSLKGRRRQEAVVLGTGIWELAGWGHPAFTLKLKTWNSPECIRSALADVSSMSQESSSVLPAK